MCSVQRVGRRPGEESVRPDGLRRGPVSSRLVASAANAETRHKSSGGALMSRTPSRGGWVLAGLALVPVAAAIAAPGMNPPDSGVLTYLMTTFVGGVSGGYGGILPIAQRILFLLAAIEIVFAGLLWALKGENFIVPLIQKTILIGVFAAFLL